MPTDDGSNSRSPTLADALDGLLAATQYAEEHGHHGLADDAATLYQRLGERADWPDGERPDDFEIDDVAGDRDLPEDVFEQSESETDT